MKDLYKRFLYVIDIYPILSCRTNICNLLSARKAGFAASSGDYIGFVDGDDWVEPETFMNMHNAIIKYSPDMALSDFLSDFGERREPSDQCFEEGRMYNERSAIKGCLSDVVLYQMDHSGVDCYDADGNVFHEGRV